MEYRVGKCSQCGAEYQIPASFAHNVARCKKCGNGVVHLSAAPKGTGAGTPPDSPPPAAPAPSRVAPEARSADGPRTSPPAAESGLERPPQGERASVREQGKPPPTALLFGLGLLVVAAVLYFFRGQVFGHAPAVEPPPKSDEASNEKASALPEDG